MRMRSATRERQRLGPRTQPNESKAVQEEDGPKGVHSRAAAKRRPDVLVRDDSPGDKAEDDTDSKYRLRWHDRILLKGREGPRQRRREAKRLPWRSFRLSALKGSTRVERGVR